MALGTQYYAPTRVVHCQSVEKSALFLASILLVDSLDRRPAFVGYPGTVGQIRAQARAKCCHRPLCRESNAAGVVSVVGYIFIVYAIVVNGTAHTVVKLILGVEQIAVQMLSTIHSLATQDRVNRAQLSIVQG